MNRKKMMKSAKALHTIARISCKVFFAAAIVLVIAALVVVIFPKNSFTTDQGLPRLDLGPVTLNLTEDALPVSAMQKEKVFGSIAASTATSAILCALLGYGLLIASRCLASVMEGRPFDGAVSQGLRKIGILTLVGGLIHQVVSSLFSFLLTRDLALISLFKEGTVKSIQFNIQIDWGFVIVALALLLISYIFRYGEDLQRQDDETL